MSGALPHTPSGIATGNAASDLLGLFLGCIGLKCSGAEAGRRSRSRAPGTHGAAGRLDQRKFDINFRFEINVITAQRIGSIEKKVELCRILLKYQIREMEN